MEKLEQFENYLLRNGDRQRTIENDLGAIKRLSNIIKLEYDEIEAYLLKEYKKGSNPNSLNTLIKSVRKWGIFINNKKLTTIKYFPPRESNKGTLSKNEIESILNLRKPNNCKITTYKKWTLFLKIIAFSGMRGSEVATLTISQIDFGRGVFILDITKTKPRLVPIAPSLYTELKEYINKLNNNKLFQINGKTPYRSLWAAHFNMRVRLCNIKRPRITLHSLRYSFASRNYRRMHLFDLQEILGHKNADTTKKYASVNTEALLEAIRQDPLGYESLPYEERFKIYRENERKLRALYALNLSEEKRMKADLMRLS